MLYHLFADDTQLLKSLNPNSVDSQVLALQYMENAISKVSKWMTENKLKLNKSKTEFIIFGTGKQMQKMQHSVISIGGELIEAKPCVRNLGAYFDSELKMETHVQQHIEGWIFSPTPNTHNSEVSNRLCYTMPRTCNHHVTY